MAETISRLEQWYVSQCDDDWEHQYGIKIDTLDNPGWSVEVDLLDTALMAREFREVNHERSDSDWIRCRVRDGKFEGFGGVRNLGEVIEVFLSWAEKSESPNAM
ncbi:MAG: immunity 53 family protein [Myxococcales bacterium]